MKLIVKLQSKITLETRPVRQRFIKVLESNIRNLLRRVDKQINTGINLLDIEINTDNNNIDNRLALIDSLKRIPGISHFTEVKRYEFIDPKDILDKTLAVHAKTIENKSFCLQIKKIGTQDFNLSQIEQYVLRGLTESVKNTKLELTKPDVTIYLEIKKNELSIVTDTHGGLGGLPIGTQLDVLALVNADNDSGVASYQMIKKGCRTHYCFFNLGNSDHEAVVKQLCYYLWTTYGSSHKVKFFTVDLEPVIEKISNNVEQSHKRQLFNRLMMHAAEKIALKANIQALVTSESIEQNSSEVLASFNAVKGTTTPLVLRPLIACDKKKVTTIAREIGIEYYTKTVSEYPLNKFKNTNPILKNEEEINFNGDVLARVINEAKVYDIRDIGRATEAEIKVVDMVEQIPEGTIIIDIRSPEESENNPLTLDGVKIKPLPFYKLASQFINFDHSKEYLLYCDHGVMSKIQALLLIESGFKNVKVYRPRDKKVII
tara:strand:+ start:5480 stop:6943 length:1464 start_codon:yes stop_codon:yes gene_type:complete